MKKAIIALLVAATLTTTTTVMAASKFSDVKETDWAAPSIEFMVNKKVVNGYEDGTFKPANPVSKAEFAHMYHLLFPNTEKKSGPMAPFKDIKNHWATNDFKALFGGDEGWIFADHFDKENNPFLAPNKQLTRWDVMMLIGLLTKELDALHDEDGNSIVKPSEVLKTISAYKDIKIRPMVGFEDSPVFTPEIHTITEDGITYGGGDIDNIKIDLLYSAIKKGIMAGANGKFRPSDKVTRAEAVTILKRVYDELNK